MKWITPKKYLNNIDKEDKKENINYFNEEREYGFIEEDYIDDYISEESWEKIEEDYQNNIINDIDILDFEKGFNHDNYSSLGYKRLREKKDFDENNFI